MSTLAEKTVNAILQTPEKITVGATEYEIAPPTCATLLEVSKRIPDVPFVDTLGDTVNEALACAKDSRPIFEMVAILILGAKAVREQEKRPKWWPFRKKTRLEKLTQQLMDECSPTDIKHICAVALSKMEVRDFFEFTASLQEVSLIQMTRAAETTASGQ